MGYKQNLQSLLHTKHEKISNTYMVLWSNILEIRKSNRSNFRNRKKKNTGVLSIGTLGSWDILNNYNIYYFIIFLRNKTGQNIP